MAEKAGGSSSAVTGLGFAHGFGGARSPASSSQQFRVWERLSVVVLVMAAVGACLPERPALLPGLLALALVTPRLVVVDLREHRLPNPLVASAAAGVLVSWLVHWLVSGAPAISALLAGVGVGAVLLLLAVLGGLGMGDVKLGAVLALAAAIVDPSLAVVVVVVATLIGGVQSVVVLAVTRDRRRSIAFGPALLAGYWLPVCWLAVFPG